MADYLATRNQALLDAEMGLGEYTYIYVDNRVLKELGCESLIDSKCRSIE